MRLMLINFIEICERLFIQIRSEFLGIFQHPFFESAANKTRVSHACFRMVFQTFKQTFINF